MSKIQLFVIHCTATHEGQDITGDDIDLMHRSPKKNPDGSYTFMGKTYSSVPPELPERYRNRLGNGWTKVGYWGVIRLDGTFDELVPMNDDDNVDPWEITYGASGYNSISRHIVYAGGLEKGSLKPKDTRTPEQSRALELIVKQFIAAHPDVKVAGHGELPGVHKACPSFDVSAWCKKIGLEAKNIYKQ
ncbi:MAG: N-acetylmuramoyl-L-alanine amidase [Bacteroidetes bacterium]|nr:N-acetylmuramoyl-L-alanine amidase [Bacteroidota bacterium]